jgi:hypothetical protein
MAGQPISTPSIREDGLQLEEHRHFQERFWTAQRVAWVVFGLFLLAALLGFTGAGGPFSRTTATVAGGIVDYPIISRWQAADEMVVRFAPGPEERRLRLSTTFADALQIEGIQPEPERSLAGPEGAELTFATQPGAAAEVTIHVSPLGPGYFSFDVGIDDGAPATLGTLVLP